MAARAAALLALDAAPSVALRGRPAGTQPRRAEPVGPGPGGIALAARSSRARACARRRELRATARRLARLAGRPLDEPWQSADARPDRRPIGVHAPYDHALCDGAGRGGGGGERRADHERFAYGAVPSPDGYAVRELFYRRAVGAPGSPARLAASWSSTCPDMLALPRLARGGDVVHFQWLAGAGARPLPAAAPADRAHRARPASRASPGPGRRGPSGGSTTRSTRSSCTRATAASCWCPSLGSTRGRCA